jgi:hypothetical protein
MVFDILFTDYCRKYITFYESIAIFKIGRDRCKTNELMFNFEKSLGIKCFAHNKSKLIKIAEYIRKKIYILRNIKLKKINYFIKSFILYKFFKKFFFISFK